MTTIAAHLTDAANMAGADVTGRPCRYATTLDRLDDADRAAVVNALTAKTASPEKVAAVLRSGGYQIARTTIRHHLAGMCSCAAPATEKDAA